MEDEWLMVSRAGRKHPPSNQLPVIQGTGPLVNDIQVSCENRVPTGNTHTSFVNNSVNNFFSDIRGTIVELQPPFAHLYACQIEDIQELAEFMAGGTFVFDLSRCNLNSGYPLKIGSRVQFSVTIDHTLFSYDVTNVTPVLERNEDEIYQSSKSGAGLLDNADVIVCYGEISKIPRNPNFCFARLSVPEESQHLLNQSEDFYLASHRIFSLNVPIVAGDEIEATFAKASIKKHQTADKNPVISRAYVTKFKNDPGTRNGCHKLQTCNWIIQVIKIVKDGAENEIDMLQNFSSALPSKSALKLLLRSADQQPSSSKKTILRTILILLDHTMENYSPSFNAELMVELDDRNFSVLIEDYLCSYNNGELATSDVRIERFVKFLFDTKKVVPLLFEQLRSTIQNSNAPQILQSGMYAFWDQMDAYSLNSQNPVKDVELVPTNDDISLAMHQERAVHERLPQICVTAPFNSFESYLESYFTLLRHDSTCSLLKGIKRWVLEQSFDVRDTNLALGGAFLKLTIDGVSNISFSLDVKVVQRNESAKFDDRKFKSGNLVAITASGSFDDIVWATIARTVQNYSSAGRAFIQLESLARDSKTLVKSLQTIMRGGDNLSLVESPTYYKAYRPVMQSMQTLTRDQFPFARELVYSSEQLPPDYLQSIGPETSDFPGFIDTLLKRPEIHEQISTLDPSQFCALRNVLSHRIGIVQGPPGTGKTFLGVKLTNLLLSLKQGNGEKILSGPILVLTYKNRALDEFASAILQNPIVDQSGHFIRLGSQSKNPQMQGWSLRDACSEPAAFERQLTAQIKALNRDIIDEVDHLQKMLSSESSLDPLVVLKHFDHVQLGQLVSRVICENDYHTKLRSYQQPDQMGEVLFHYLTDNRFRSGVQYLWNQLLRALELWLPSDEDTRKTVKAIEDSILKNRDIDEDGSSISDRSTDEMSSESWRSFDEMQLDDSSDFLQALQHGVSKPLFNPYETTSFQCLKSHGVATTAVASSVDLDVLKNYRDPWQIPKVERLYYLQKMIVKQDEYMFAQLDKLLAKRGDLEKQRSKVKNYREASALRNAHVIAGTITGCALRTELLKVAKPPVIIVEEAAEISEAHLIPLLGEHVAHLVLIGDHLQLRPHVDCYWLEERCNFGVSMMERLINCNLTFTSLATQNRMRPDISKYLRDIYPDLKDNQRVLLHPAVSCVQSNIFFWDHDHKEESERSFWNEEEAKSVLKFVTFIHRFNGTELENITVLAGYQGQTQMIRRMLPDFNLHKGSLRVQTVDMYQGDENDIVIVSLVRNNPNRNPGFLGLLNRRCVAQSRGRSGVYFLGNAETLETKEKSAEVWTPFLDHLRRDGCFGEEMVVKCRHHDHVTKEVKVGEDFPSDRFCFERCKVVLSCGLHQCEQPCQPYHQADHALDCRAPVEFTHRCGKHKGTRDCCASETTQVCNAPCDFLFHADSDGETHKCVDKCGVKHSHDFCKTKVKFSCSKNSQHRLTRLCHEDESDVVCTETEEFVYPSCVTYKHKGVKKCYESAEGKVCGHTCESLREPCGHPCGSTCQPGHSHDNIEAQCEAPVDFDCKKCTQRLTRKCFQRESEVECTNLVRVEVSCGKEDHRIEVPCGKDVDEGDLKCRDRCRDKLKCGHFCQELCSSEHSHEDKQCLVLLTFKHRCGNDLKRHCHQSETGIPCGEVCRVKLECGHDCGLDCEPYHVHDSSDCKILVEETCKNCKKPFQKHCSDKNPKCPNIVEVKLPRCGHNMTKKCFKKLEKVKCKASCPELLEQCSHKCSKLCGDLAHDHSDSSKCEELVMFVHECGDTGRRKCNESVESSICQGECKQRHPCGHKCKQKCRPRHSHSQTCGQMESFKCPNCDQQLEKLCGQSKNDVSCSRLVTITCRKCHRTFEDSCFVKSQKLFRCSLPCKKQLPDCGHKCPLKCHEDCKFANCRKCRQPSIKTPVKGFPEKQKFKNQDEAKKEELMQQLDNLQVTRFSKPSFLIIDPIEIDLEDTEEVDTFLQLRDKALNHIVVDDGCVPSVKKVVLVNNAVAQKKLIEEQLKLKDINGRMALAYYTEESSKHPERFGEVGLHGASQESQLSIRQNGVVLSRLSLPISSENVSKEIAVLILDVLTGRTKSVREKDFGRASMSNSGAYDSIVINCEDGNQKHVIFNAYHIVVTGYVIFELEPFDYVTEGIDTFLKSHARRNQPMKIDASRELTLKPFQENCLKLINPLIAKVSQGLNLNLKVKSITVHFDPRFQVATPDRNYEESSEDDSKCEELLIQVDPAKIATHSEQLKPYISKISKPFVFCDLPEEHFVKSGVLDVALVDLGIQSSDPSCGKISIKRNCDTHDTHFVDVGRSRYFIQRERRFSTSFEVELFPRQKP